MRLGYNVSIAGSHKNIKDVDLNVNFKIYIPSFGSGSLYSPAYINKRKMIAALDLIKPDLLLIEAWQTAITDFSIDIASKLGIPTAMISHGISVYPYTNELKYKLRALFWFYYRFFQFPKRLSKICALGVLDINANSPRFYDRDLALKVGLPVTLIPNMPINFSTSYRERESRSAQIIVLGYFSPIKNQLAAINIFAKFIN